MGMTETEQTFWILWLDHLSPKCNECPLYENWDGALYETCNEECMRIYDEPDAFMYLVLAYSWRAE